MDERDPELVAVLAQITGDRGFGHREHVRLAFVAVRRYGMPAAADRAARRGWVEPNLRPLPRAAAQGR